VRLVGRARDWRWSSSRAHLTGKNGGITALTPVRGRRAASCPTGDSPLLARMFDCPARSRRATRDCRQNGLRQKTHFASRLKQITPVQPCREKYFSFCFSEIDVS
jgi:hypothetical protein